MPAGAEAPFQLTARVPRAHARVIWGCTWAPCGRVAATGARDCTVKLWRAATACGEAGAPSETRAW
jgi:elongator complex protein 2